MSEIERPEIVEDGMLMFLDSLLERGTVNMFDAGFDLRVAFGMSRRDARTVLKYWMKTFGKREGEVDNG